MNILFIIILKSCQFITSKLFFSWDLMIVLAYFAMATYTVQ